MSAPCQHVWPKTPRTDELRCDRCGVRFMDVAEEEIERTSRKTRKRERARSFLRTSARYLKKGESK
jgi:hypothetical protein